MIHILGEGHSLFNEFISEIRDQEIQQDRMRFRRNLERMGEIFAYEISKKLSYSVQDVTTSLGIAKVEKIVQQPVVATILRAGLPMHFGILNYFDRADNAFISAYRKHHKNGTFDVQVDYMSSPDLTDRTLIICDPMLATGRSMVLAYNALLKNGKPKHTHIVSLIASSEAITYTKLHLPESITLWTGAIDSELTAQSYIVPGLGDAGDLAFGEKS